MLSVLKLSKSMVSIQSQILFVQLTLIGCKRGIAPDLPDILEVSAFKEEKFYVCVFVWYMSVYEPI